jgi:hypothetical protein
MSVINIADLKHKDDEIKTPAVAVYVEKACPKCGFGKMEATGRAAQPDSKLPPIFEHSCNKCQHKEAYRKQYPTVEFVKVEPEVKEGEREKKN